MREVFKSILAGICIGIAGTVYLRIDGLAGAVLFAFGLMTVISLNLWLFTGMAYKVWRYGHVQLLCVLILNVVGCLLVSSVSTTPELTAKAESIIQQRLHQGAVDCGLLSIGCGFIMTTAVISVRKYNNWRPLLFGVPVFIVCGFPHCVADSFYLETCSPAFLRQHVYQIVAFYVCVVIGNYLGCNLYRLTLNSNYTNKT